MTPESYSNSITPKAYLALFWRSARLLTTDTILVAIAWSETIPKIKAKRNKKDDNISKVHDSTTEKRSSQTVGLGQRSNNFPMFSIDSTWFKDAPIDTYPSKVSLYLSVSPKFDTPFCGSQIGELGTKSCTDQKIPSIQNFTLLCESSF